MSHWHQKVIVVTGGSAGFGLILAETFAASGATVVILSRQVEHLQAACETSAYPLNWVVCDVCVDVSVTNAVEQIRDRFGRVDVWINNVGMSGRFDFMGGDLDQYIDLMDVNFFSAVRCTLAVLPLIAESSGSIVNMGSLASKTGWKHISPYTASKHALAAFSHQTRLEAPANVHCLFVCCGPIRRDDSETRYDDQSSTLADGVAKPGAGVRLKGLDPQHLARKIETAVRRRKKELIVPFYARLLFMLQQLSPTLGDWLLGRFNKSR